MKKSKFVYKTLFCIMAMMVIISCTAPGRGSSGGSSGGSSNNGGTKTNQTDITGMPAVVLPAGYVASLLNITISSVTVPSTLTGGYKPVGKAYDITYNGGSINFGTYFANLTYSYKTKDLNDNGLLDEFVLFYFDTSSSSWKRADKTYVNSGNNQVIGETTHFTTFVLTAMPSSGATSVQSAPANINSDYPTGIAGSCGALFTVIDENFKYYQDRDYYILPTASSANNQTTFNALGFFGALGIATINGYSGSGINLGPESANKLYTGSNYIVFTAHQALDVYVMYDTRGGTSLLDLSQDAPWLQSYGFTADITTTLNPTPTRYFVETTDAVGLYKVYRKSYNSGDVIRLDGNRKGVTDPGIQTNYWVILKSKGVYTNEPAGAMGSAPDTTPPANVTNLQASVSASSITLSWTNPTDADFAGVVIRRSTTAPAVKIDDGTAPTGTVLSPQSFRDNSITVGLTYYYTVFSLDVNQNYQLNGTYIVVTVPSTAPSLSGHVRDASGNPVFGAYIQLYNAGYSATTSSDVNGYYEFDSVPAGTYYLVVQRDGFTLFTQVVTITP